MCIRLVYNAQIKPDCYINVSEGSPLSGSLFCGWCFAGEPIIREKESE